MTGVPLPSRPVLAGNSHAAVYVLELLLEAWPADSILVIAPPGGVHHAWQPSLPAAASARGVEVIDPSDVNDAAVVDRVRAHGADLLLSVYYTQLFKGALLGAVAGPALNFHPSLLPRHRGVAPLIWAIAEGDEMVGVSVHELTLGVDTGPLVLQRPLPVHPDDTGFELHMKAAALVRSTAAELLRALREGRPLPVPVAQSGPASSHTTRDPQLNQLDWRDPAQRVRNIVRALALPLPGAHTGWNGVRVGVERVEVLPAPRVSRPPGMVEIDGDGAVVVWAGDGPLGLVDVRVDGTLQPATVLVDQGLTEGDFLA